jgi:hypothetical protein
LAPGQTLTNFAVVCGEDDEGNAAKDEDDASITAYNLGRTPGFWSHNGKNLWDGDTGTAAKNGSGLGIVNGPKNPGANTDLAYLIHDLDGDGVVDDVAGNNQYLMIGDWNKDGIAQDSENVLVISREDALLMLQSNFKETQDSRYQVGRDVVASWLNYLGGSHVGESDDPNSAMHYIDEALAWLIRTTDQDHVLSIAELSTGKVPHSTGPWKKGYDFDGNGIRGENMTPAADFHDIGIGTDLDIMSGSAIHSGLDHFNNHGFVL